MAPDVANFVSERGDELAYDRLRVTAEGTLEVAVLDERHDGLPRTADVVASRVDVVGEVEDVLGRGDDLPGPDRPRQSLEHAEDAPRHQRPHERRADHAQL